MSFEDKYNLVAYELFGDLDDQEDWERENHRDDERDSPAEGDPEGGVRDKGSDNLDDACETPDEDGACQEKPEYIWPRAPRARRIHLPKSIRFRAAAVVAGGWSTDLGAERDKGYKNFNEKAAMVAAPASRRKITKISDRRLMEYCCSEDSRLGRHKYQVMGCSVIRLTEKHDLTTESGLEEAIKAVREARDDEYVHLWGSLPCTGGSPWQFINSKHEGPEERMQEHLGKFEILFFGNFQKVAKEVLNRGGDVLYEWPTGCTLWKHHAVQQFITEHSMNSVDINGCALGLKSTRTGEPIKKPCTIISTSPAMIKALEGYRCPGKEVHPRHDPCAGSQTKLTESYTDQMTDIIHDAIKDESVASRARRAMAAIKPTNAGVRGGLRGDHGNAGS